MRVIIGSLLLVGLLVACTSESDKIAFDGKFFRTKLSDLDERHEFQVTSQPVSKSLAGAREAARYEATIYCVNEYGSSAIEWVIDPDAPVETLPIKDDTLTLQGACPL